jgi:hypothetical protein
MDTMTSMTLIGLFGLALVIAGGVGASFFAKRNDEMQSGGHQGGHH